MATRHKQIGTKQTPEKNKGTYLTQENWEVMKPFVHFAFKAITVIGATMFAIIKLIPKTIEHKPEEHKSGRVIKI